MGKGDQRTRRGKLYRGSYGRTRRRKKPKRAMPPPPKPKKATEAKEE
ncbi:MAG: 30S ribosomal protein THX [Candidatus Neomarinimicrobiota bacterium]